ncbi:MAG: hypothetical protein NW703_12625 [Nitrospiraceae bacterium]
MLASPQLVCYASCDMLACHSHRPNRSSAVALAFLSWLTPAWLTLTWLAPVFETEAGSFDSLTDLTGKAVAVVTFKSRDNFSNEYRYDVTIRNVGVEPLVGDSIVLVLDRITNVGGEEREPLKNETLLNRMDILGADGYTDEGKPFFYASPDGQRDLLPQSDTVPVGIRLRNRDYVAVFTLSFRVFGQRREREKEKPAVKTAEPPPKQAGKPSLDKLIQLMIRKGLLTEEESRTLHQGPASPP